MTENGQRHPAIIGITGASGSVLARAAIDSLLTMGVPVITTASSAALRPSAGRRGGSQTRTGFRSTETEQDEVDRD